MTEHTPGPWRHIRNYGDAIAVEGDTDNHICLHLFGGLIVTVKDIVKTATRERDSAKVTVFRYGVV